MKQDHRVRPVFDIDKNVPRKRDPSCKMTEEEMMDMAVHLSEQEANDMALRHQQDKDAVMKAIHESSCGKLEVCVTRLSQNLLETCQSCGFVLCSQDRSSQIIVQPQSPTFPRSSDNQANRPKGPGNIVADHRIPAPLESQGGCEDDGDTQYSPYLKSQIFDGNMQRHNFPIIVSEPDGPTNGSSSLRSISFCQDNSLLSTASSHPCSPIFPRSPVLPSNLSQRGCCEASLGPALDQRGQQQERDDDGQMMSDTDISQWNSNTSMTQLAGSHSPVFPQEKTMSQIDVNTSCLNDVTTMSARTTTRLHYSSACRQPLCTTMEELRPISNVGVEFGGMTFHYYWGVPFCPRGLNADTYTQVILTQMDVYHQKLKEAQRSLLRKAPWGKAILPQLEIPSSPESPATTHQDLPAGVVPQRQRWPGLRIRKQDDSTPAEEEQQGQGKEGQKEEAQRKEGEEQVKRDSCVHPEAELNNDSEDTLSDPPSEPWPEILDAPEVDNFRQGDFPLAVEPQKDENLEVNGKAGNFNHTSHSKQDRNKEAVMSEQAEPDVDILLPPTATVPSCPGANVNCPICLGSFPVKEIELHAAFCDGGEAVVVKHKPEVESVQASLRPHRKRARKRGFAHAEHSPTFSSSSLRQEKCYVCQKLISLQDYPHHTELCITQPQGKDLLSAIQDTEKNKKSKAGVVESKPSQCGY